MLDDLEEEEDDDDDDEGGEEHESFVQGGSDNAGLGFGLQQEEQVHGRGQSLRIMTLEEMREEERRVDRAEGRSGIWGMLRGMVGW